MHKTEFILRLPGYGLSVTTKNNLKMSSKSETFFSNSLLPFFYLASHKITIFRT